MEALISARDLIAKTLEESNRVSTAMEASSSHLERLNSELSLSSELLRSLHRRTSTLSSLSLQADIATGPVSAYSSVVLLIRSLSVSHLSPDLSGYLALVRRLEQALSFLTDNCALAINWLNDAANSLLDDDRAYASNVNRSLAALEELRAMEVRERLPGGGLCLALDKLQIELCRILEREIKDDDDDEIICAIVERLRSNGRGSRVGPIYLQARVSVVKSQLHHYNPETVAEWGSELEFAVTQVFAFEHRLSRRLGGALGIGIEEWYAEIVVKSGFMRMLGLEVAGKKDAMRLLKLLEVFGVVESLRPEFNRLFGGRECEKVREATRELVRGIVEGSWEIFCQLAVEVERQPPPLNSGGVPPLVAFVTHYCRELAQEKYRVPLIQVLAIHQTWHPGRPLPPHRLLVDQIRRVMRALEVNINTWSNNLNGSSSSFLLDNYRYLYDHLMGSELGNLLGEEWLAEYRHKIDLYAQHKLPCQDERITHTLVASSRMRAAYT